MKITAIKTSMLRVPNNPPVSTYYRENRYVVARIQTDEGLEGLGYTMLVGGAGAESVREYLEKSLVPQLIGENPLHVGRLWQNVPELSIHVLVSVPNAALVEVLAGAPSELWKEPPEVKNGMMAPPNRPGHGMEFSAEALKRFTE